MSAHVPAAAWDGAIGTGTLRRDRDPARAHGVAGSLTICGVTYLLDGTEEFDTDGRYLQLTLRFPAEAPA